MTSDGRFLLRRGTLPEVAPEQLVDILTSACDVALVVSAEREVISVLVNPQMGIGAKVAHWQGAPLKSLLTPESWIKLDKRLGGGEMDTHRPMIVELTHSDAQSFQFPIRYAVSRTATDGAFLMVGHDLRPIAELQQQLVQAQLALERDYETQREMETRYRVLMEMSPVPLMIVSMSSGKIIDLNTTAAELIGAPRTELLDAAVAQEFDGRRRGEFLESLAKLSGADPNGALELTVRRTRAKVLVSAGVFRAAGDRLLLCRIGLSETGKAQVNELADLTERLFAKGIDAVVFLDGEGVVKSANESFLNLTDTANIAAVRGRSLTDFLARGAVDLRMLLDNVKRTGQLRLYATRLTTDFMGQIAVEISATWLNDRPNPVLVLVVRDASRAETLRRPAFGQPDDGVRNVMELVGSSTLKDIVAETTDVIEKMCIETALELTRNNRVAAAEMLSLSRQSLYVKLRKYGLINKDGE